MLSRRTDLALEAHALYHAAAKKSAPRGLSCREYERGGCRVTVVLVKDAEAARALGKPEGRYVTLDLRTLREQAADWIELAAAAITEELRTLMPDGAESALVVGLGNRAMTPDIIGPECARHILATRHLRRLAAFSSLADVSVFTPGVLGQTGLEAVELVRGAVKAADPDVVIAVDALCAQRLGRVCTTVQLSDAGIIPGSGVGNHRGALTKETLGVPVLAVGVPTVVDAVTLTRDVLEEAGMTALDAEALRGHEGVMVTLRDIDAQAVELSRAVGFGIDLALQPTLSLGELRSLLV